MERNFSAVLVAIADTPVAYLKAAGVGSSRQKAEGVLCPFGSRLMNQARRRHLRIPASLATRGHSSTLNSTRTFRWPLRNQPANSTFCYQQHFGERKDHAEGSSCFLRRRRNSHDCSLHADTG